MPTWSHRQIFWCFVSLVKFNCCSKLPPPPPAPPRLGLSLELKPLHFVYIFRSAILISIFYFDFLFVLQDLIDRLSEKCSIRIFFLLVSNIWDHKFFQMNISSFCWNDTAWTQKGSKCWIKTSECQKYYSRFFFKKGDDYMSDWLNETRTLQNLRCFKKYRKLAPYPLIL